MALQLAHAKTEYMATDGRDGDGLGQDERQHRQALMSTLRVAADGGVVRAPFSAEWDAEMAKGGMAEAMRGKIAARVGGQGRSEVERPPHRVAEGRPRGKAWPRARAYACTGRTRGSGTAAR